MYYLVDFSDAAATTTNAYQAMNVDLGFFESQYGLVSVAFTFLYAVASLGAGIVLDWYNRKNVTIAASLACSLVTLGTTLSRTYAHVVLCRAAMGLACAFTNDKNKTTTATAAAAAAAAATTITWSDARVRTVFSTYRVRWILAASFSRVCAGLVIRVWSSAHF
jgi:MFS family permease